MGLEVRHDKSTVLITPNSVFIRPLIEVKPTTTEATPEQTLLQDYPETIESGCSFRGRAFTLCSSGPPYKVKQPLKKETLFLSSHLANGELSARYGGRPRGFGYGIH